MSKELEQEALDVAKWWAYHKNECSDVAKTVEFLTKANDHLLWLLGRAIQDIKNLEHRDKVENNFRGLALPLGIKLHDGIRTRN